MVDNTTALFISFIIACNTVLLGVIVYMVVEVHSLLTVVRRELR